MRNSFLALAIAAGLGLPGQVAAAEKEYDVVVYGGTSGGISAAVQAARMGKSVILIEPGKHLGGLTSGGLGATDIGNKRAIGGISREFYQRIKKHYAEQASWKYETRANFKGPGHDPKEDAAWSFEPHVAEQVFAELLREHKVPVVFSERLDLKKGVRKEGSRIVAITMESGQTYRGRMFIDATYEGDLMAKAGVSYHVGREANRTYGETLNGVQVKNATHHQFVKKVDPYVKPGDPLQRPAAVRPRRASGQGRRGGQACPGVQLPALCHRPAREPPALAKAGRLRREALRDPAAQLRGRRQPHSVEPHPDAQPQDRLQQQFRFLDRRHRPQLRLSGGRLRCTAPHLAGARPLPARV